MQHPLHTVQTVFVLQRKSIAALHAQLGAHVEAYGEMEKRLRGLHSEITNKQIRCGTDGVCDFEPVHRGTVCCCSVWDAWRLFELESDTTAPMLMYIWV
jgi:hypothetical protein